MALLILCLRANALQISYFSFKFGSMLVSFCLLYCCHTFLLLFLLHVLVYLKKVLNRGMEACASTLATTYSSGETNEGKVVRFKMVIS